MLGPGALIWTILGLEVGKRVEAGCGPSAHAWVGFSHGSGAITKPGF